MLVLFVGSTTLDQRQRQGYQRQGHKNLSAIAGFNGMNRRTGLLSKTTLAVIALFCCLLFQVVVRIATLQQSYALEEVRSESFEKSRELGHLKLALSLASTPERLQGMALARLNMSSVAPDKVRKVRTIGQLQLSSEIQLAALKTGAR